MLEAGGVESCVATQLYRYAVGRTDIDKHDRAFVQGLVKSAAEQGGLRLHQMVLDYATSDVLRHRREGDIQ